MRVCQFHHSGSDMAGEFYLIIGTSVNVSHLFTDYWDQRAPQKPPLMTQVRLLHDKDLASDTVP